MKTAEFTPAKDQQVTPGVVGRRAASATAVLSAPVINMGLVEIQRQAKAS